jgi:hypothetical protein
VSQSNGGGQTPGTSANSGTSADSGTSDTTSGTSDTTHPYPQSTSGTGDSLRFGSSLGTSVS